MPKTFAIGLVLALLAGCGSKGRPTYDENGATSGDGNGNGIGPGLSPTAPGDTLTLEPASASEVKEGQPLPIVEGATRPVAPIRSARMERAVAARR